MPKNIILHFWSMRREFVKYFITGISAVILDIGSLYLLKNLLNVKPFIAVIINQPFMLCYVFFINKYWSFKAKGLSHAQMIRFLSLSLGNYAVAAIWMWGFNEVLGINYLVSRLGNVAVAVAWNFLLYKYWVYKYAPVIAEIRRGEDRSNLPA